MCDLPWKETQEVAELESENKRLTAEVERLSALLYGARCIYCGWVASPESRNQDIGDAELQAHIEVCEKHPVRQLRANLEAAQTALATARAEEREASVERLITYQKRWVRPCPEALIEFVRGAR